MPPVDPDVVEAVRYAQRRATACGVPYTIACGPRGRVMVIRGKRPEPYRQIAEIVYPERREL